MLGRKKTPPPLSPTPPSSSESINTSGNDESSAPPPPVKKSWFGSKPKEPVENAEPPKKSWFSTKPKPNKPDMEKDVELVADEEIVEDSEEEVEESDEEEVEESDEEEVEESDDEEVEDEEEVEESDEEEVEDSEVEEFDEEGGEAEETEEKSENGDLENLLGADSEDEGDVHDAEEEERFVQHCKAKLTENYQVARWIKQIELKKKIAVVREIQNQKEANDKIKKGTTWFGKSESIAVEDYWDDEAKIKATMSSAAIKGIHIIQVVWKYWLELKRLRVARKVATGGADMIIYVQTAIRRWEARQTAITLREERIQKMKEFKEFCEVMKKGVTLMCFSRKYGGSGPRLLKFNDDNTELTYVAGFMNTRSIELKSIYQVGEGMSGYTYPNANPTRTAWCFYLELIGDKFLDFECFSKQQVHMMVHGFRRLRHLFYTMSPFYFDALGTPRRAGPSIIEMGLKGGGKVESLSIADEMRYRQALRCLNFEYGDWSNLYDKEKSDWEEQNLSVFDSDAKGSKEELAEEHEEIEGIEGETVAATEITEDIGGSVVESGEVVESNDIVESDDVVEAPVKKPSRFWNIMKLGSKFKRQPKKEPDNIEKLDGFVDANNISVAELEAILDKKRAESAANSGEESEYEEIEVSDSDEELVEESDDVEESEEEEEQVDEEEEQVEEVEEQVEEEKAAPQEIRKVQPLHPNLPKSAPSDRNKHTKEIRYTPL